MLKCTNCEHLRYKSVKYRKTVVLKDGRKCVIRNGTAEDGKAALQSFIVTHRQTDNLLSYPDEITLTEEKEALFLAEKSESANEAELVAEIDGYIAGLAGINAAGSADKISRRAEFGVSVEKDYWGLGVGRALTRACIECARSAGYTQIELDVIADNEAAISLYKSEGFVEYGFNPRGFLTREGKYQPLILFRLEL